MSYKILKYRLVHRSKESQKWYIQKINAFYMSKHMQILTLALITLLFFGACKNQDETIKRPDTETGLPSEGLSYLALGDSYTIGQSVTVAERWPVLFAKDFNKKGKTIAEPEIIARTGWTTGDLLNALNGNPPVKKYDLVSLLIGVNNQYQGRSIDQYRLEFRELLVKSIGYAGDDVSKVFVLSTPDWGVTPYANGNNTAQIAKEIDSFNKVAKEECDKLKVRFIDITPISRKALNDPTMVANDGLHFSGKMHQLWVNEVLLFVR